MYDVAIIGAGITGTFIARELSRYELDIVILEKIMIFQVVQLRRIQG